MELEQKIEIKGAKEFASYYVWKSFYILTLFTFFTGSIIVIMYWYDLLISDRAKLGDVPVRTDVLDSIKRK